MPTATILFPPPLAAARRPSTPAGRQRHGHPACHYISIDIESLTFITATHRRDNRNKSLGRQCMDDTWINLVDFSHMTGIDDFRRFVLLGLIDELEFFSLD